MQFIFETGAAATVVK